MARRYGGLGRRPVARARPSNPNPIGTPIWQPTGFSQFSAPLGTPDNLSLFNQTVAAVLPNHAPIRVPHDGPYDQEITQGVANAGFVNKTVFDTSEFNAPSGIFFGFIIVPGAGAPVGSSFDFASGPIIPNSILPLRLTGDLFRNGEIFEANAITFTFNPSATRDGNSHNVLLTAENSSFAPPGLTDLTGAYEYRLTLRDTTGSGYDLSARFQVVPEPGTLVLLGAGALGLLACGRRRRSAA